MVPTQHGKFKRGDLIRRNGHDPHIVMNFGGAVGIVYEGDIAVVDMAHSLPTLSRTNRRETVSYSAVGGENVPQVTNFEDLFDFAWA